MKDSKMLLTKKVLLYCYKKTQEFTIRHRKLANTRLFRSYRRRCINYVQSKCSSNFIVLDGRKMYVDEEEYLKLLLEHDGIMTKFVKNEIKKGDVVLDLGAHIGYWTCLLAELVGDKGHVFAFEPEPHNFQILQKNVEMNNYKNVTLEQKAISNKTGKISLYISNVSTDHRIYDFPGNQNSIEVDVVRLDDYFKDKEVSINYLKSNLQGADFAAIQGMQLLLKRSKNLKMIVEYHPDTLQEFGFNPSEFIETLVNEGFRLYDVGRCEIKPIEPSKVLEKYPPSGKNIGTSFLCIRQN